MFEVLRIVTTWWRERQKASETARVEVETLTYLGTRANSLPRYPGTSAAFYLHSRWLTRSLPLSSPRRHYVKFVRSRLIF